MIATAPPRAPETVDSLWRIGWRLWAAKRAPHGADHDCFACAEVRAYIGARPLSIRIGRRILPSFRADGSRP